MQEFKKILFVSYGLSNEEVALKTAIATTNSNNANLKIVIFTPTLPDSLKEYKKLYQDAFLAKTQQIFKKISGNMPLAQSIDDRVTFSLESNNDLAVNIIKMVLREKFDLVIKAAEQTQSNHGLNAVEMSLLRKCPCPVWICKPDANMPIRNIAVTIDPDNSDQVRIKLTQELLRLADDLAQKQGAKLTVISIWDCPFEEAMRDSSFYSIPQEILDSAYVQEEKRANAAIADLLQKAPLKSKYDIIVKKGITFIVIPEILNANNIDLLIIGTVARTGIPGFIIGNTAENIFKNISCSVLAIKPEGYVSPIIF